MMGRIIYVLWIWKLFCPVFCSNSFSSLNKQNLGLTLRTETRALWDIPVTQAGSEWWSDKLGYLSVSVPCFSNNCRQSRAIQITFCYKLVLFARHTLELCPCPVPLYFFPSCLTPFFSVTCCSQLSILAVLLSISLPGSWQVVAVVQKESLINDNVHAGQRHKRWWIWAGLWGLATFCWLILRKINIKFPIHHTSVREEMSSSSGCKMYIQFLLWNNSSCIFMHLTAVKLPTA